MEVKKSMEAKETTGLKRPFTRKQLAELKAALRMTKRQREVLVGLLLGDGHLGTQDGGRTWRLVYSQSRERHGTYLEGVHELFKNWTVSPPALVKGIDGLAAQPPLGSEGGEGGAERPSNLHKGGVPIQKEGGDPGGKPSGRFRTKNRLKLTTVAHASLRFYGKAFYKDGVKVVPKRIGKLLTARGLAYWYMDDGSIKSRESEGLILKTHSFPLAGVELLCQVLGERFGLRAKPRLQRSASGVERHQIYISGLSFERARELILPHLHPDMVYKFPPPRTPRGRSTAL